MNVSAWSIRNPIPAILLFVLLTLAGIFAFRAMKIQQFMDIDLPTVTVTATLPGAAPAQMETEVENLFACGDGAGVTRGLVQASASGMVAAQAVRQRLTAPQSAAKSE